MKRVGVYFFSLSTLAAGVMDFVWGDFEAAHQPIQAFGDHIPGRRIFAYIIAVWMIAGGAAMLSRKTARVGAAAVAVVYLIFAIFWLPRLYTAPHVLGFRIDVLVGVVAAIFQELILVVGGIIAYTSADTHALPPQKSHMVARWTFGLGSVLLGWAHLTHLTRVQVVAPMVPKWMPLGGEFWAIVTGICFVLAGIAILSGVQDVVATRFLALMLFIFSVSVLAPNAFAFPRSHVAWGSNAYNLAAVGAAWMLAEAVASPHSKREQDTEERFAHIS
jgi:uncharacterized membrane protein YphA (DoxX/SURF4 family)